MQFYRLLLIGILCTRCTLFGMNDKNDLATIEGAQLNDLRTIDYNAVVNAFPRQIQNFENQGKPIGEDVKILLGHAQKAIQNQNQYHAFRYTIKAMASHYKEYSMEDYEMAASLRIIPQAGLLSLTDKLAIIIEPIFDLGKSLSGKYIAKFIVRDSDYKTVTESSIDIIDFDEHRIDIPINLREDGEFYVGYKLYPPNGKPFAEVPYTFLAIDNSQNLAKNLARHVNRLKNRTSAISDITLNETMDYILNCFEVEQKGYDGFARNFPAICRMQFFWDQRDFRQPYMGKVSFPVDINTINSYLEISDNKRAFLGLTGDYKQVIKVNDSVLYHYRIYIPENYQENEAHPLCAIFPMGMEVDDFFNSENLLKAKADELGWMIVCAGNFEFNYDNREEQMLQAIDRVKQLYMIDEDRIFLAGGGNSGDLVWHTGLKNNVRFRSLVPISGSAPWLSELPNDPFTDLSILSIVGSNEHQDIYENVLKTKAIAEGLFKDFQFTEIENADHISVWGASLPKIIEHLQSIQ